MASVKDDTDRNADLNLPLPEGWVSARLGLIAESLTYGYTASAKAGSDGPRFLRITDLQNGRVDWNSVPTCQIAETDVHKYNLHAGDIVFARTGATTGKSFLIRSCPSAVFASYLIRLRLLSDVNPALLAYFFQTPDYWSFVSDNVAGIAQPNCNATKLSELEVPIPPSAEQQRLVEEIAASLSKVDAARNHLSRVPAILKRFRQAVLAAACSGGLTEDWREAHSNHESAIESVSRVLAERVRDYETRRSEAQSRGQRLPKRPDNLQAVDFVLPEAMTVHEIPETWTWVSVRDVISMIQYGTSVKTDSTNDQGVPMLRMGNIQHGRLDLTNLKYIARESENISEFTIAKGDVLFNRTNSPELVGKTAVYDSDLEAVFASYLIRLRCDKRIGHSAYVASWINSPWGRWWARTVRTDGVSQSNINATTLQTMPLPLPTFQEQQEIVRRIDALFKLADTVEDRVCAATIRADKLSQSILAKAFKGELVPTEAELARREGREYEPASVLLERIKAERESQTSVKPERKETQRSKSTLAATKG
jgi:type I restriction enzyme S subunit